MIDKVSAAVGVIFDGGIGIIKFLTILPPKSISRFFFILLFSSFNLLINLINNENKLNKNKNK